MPLPPSHPGGGLPLNLVQVGLRWQSVNEKVLKNPSPWKWRPDKHFPWTDEGPTLAVWTPPSPGSPCGNDSKRTWGQDHHKSVTLLPKYRQAPRDLGKHNHRPKQIGNMWKTGKFPEQVPTRNSNASSAHLDFDKTILHWKISWAPTWKNTVTVSLL